MEKLWLTFDSELVDIRDLVPDDEGELESAKEKTPVDYHHPSRAEKNGRGNGNSQSYTYPLNISAFSQSSSTARGCVKTKN